MKNKKAISNFVSIALVLLSTVCVVGNVLYLANTLKYNLNGIRYLEFALHVAAVLLALSYCLKGYSKQAGKVFKAFSWVFAFTMLVQIAGYVLPGNSLSVYSVASLSNVSLSGKNSFLNKYLSFISVILSSVMFACTFTLTFAKDLGKQKSYTLVDITMLSELILVILDLFNIDSMQFTIPVITDPNFTGLVISVIYAVIIYAKYQDKEARGTK